MLEAKAPLAYPECRTESVSDTLAGVSFPDPYRWLETNADEVRKWQRAESELASSYVRDWPHFNRLRKLVERFSSGRGASVPRYAGKQWFHTRVPEGASQAQVLVWDENMSEGRVLFDPMDEDPTLPPFVSWIAPSPDGRTLAIGTCADGSETNTIRLIDVATGHVHSNPPPQRLMDNWTGGVHWLSDSSGFFFVAISGSAIDFEQEIYLHQRTPHPSTVRVEVPWAKAKDWRMVVVSRDGQYAVAVEGLRNPIPVAIASVGEGALKWRQFVTSIEGTVAGHLVGQRYIAVTDIGAPRGRLVAIPLDAADPNDPAAWQELYAESDATLTAVTPVGNALYLHELRETYSRVRILNMDGKELGEVPLPCRGSVGGASFPMMSLVPRGHPDKYVFPFSSLTLGWGTYMHAMDDGGIQTVEAPTVHLEHAVVDDSYAVSADGTRVPYHLVYRGTLSASQPRAVLIYAYGGFNIPHVPQFPGAMAAFVAAGGVFVHAHLRGGAEFGLEWWQGGRMAKKQNCYDDLFAIAENLIATNICTSETLAVTGRSNGGLMAAVAATQRPDLWKVAIPMVPILDLIGACRDPYGRLCTMMEFANVEDPEDVRRLASFSPYHLVRDGVNYPAIFLSAGDTDPRCPPWHARKFAARLQATNCGRAPMLLHVWEGAGHGWATSKEVAVNEHTEWLAFTLRHLGVEVGSDAIP